MSELVRTITFRFSYYGAELSDYGKIEKVVIMFNDLFGKERFDNETLVRYLRV